MLQQCTMPPRNIRTAESNEQKQLHAGTCNTPEGEGKQCKSIAMHMASMCHGITEAHNAKSLACPRNSTATLPHNRNPPWTATATSNFISILSIFINLYLAQIINQNMFRQGSSCVPQWHQHSQPRVGITASVTKATHG